MKTEEEIRQEIIDHYIFLENSIAKDFITPKEVQEKALLEWHKRELEKSVERGDILSFDYLRIENGCIKWDCKFRVAPIKRIKNMNVGFNFGRMPRKLKKKLKKQRQ